jgi:DNA polymerase III delta prime subunit
VDRDLVQSIFEQALEGDHDGAMERLDVQLLKAGANPDLLVDACFDVLKRLDMPEDSRVKCFDVLTDIDRGIKQGLNPHVHFHTLLGHVYMAQGLSVYEQQGANGDN